MGQHDRFTSSLWANCIMRQHQKEALSEKEIPDVQY
jgi:hypothetical protein